MRYVVTKALAGRQVTNSQRSMVYPNLKPATNLLQVALLRPKKWKKKIEPLRARNGKWRRGQKSQSQIQRKKAADPQKRENKRNKDSALANHCPERGCAVPGGTAVPGLCMEWTKQAPF